MKLDNLIIIKGGSYNDIKKALKKWIELYLENLQDDLTFQLFKNGNGSYIIQADTKLDNDRFYYLINYLNYPEDIEYKINIEGFTVGKDENKLKNKNLLVYISPTDKEYDNVFVTTSENQSFKIDFGGKITSVEVNKTYLTPSGLSFEIPETIVVDKKYNSNNNSLATNIKLEKRFKIISAIILIAFSLVFFIFKTDSNFLIINYTMAFAVWSWFTFDYKMLQIDKLYIGSCIIGLAIFLFGSFLNKQYATDDNSLHILVGSTMPIFFLAIQRPLRFGFKKIMKREPKVEKPAPSFADFIYFFILLMASIIIPALYYTK